MTDALVETASSGARPKVWLHLGAHKTASTHFNRLLRKNHALTEAYDLATPKKESIRSLVTRRLGEAPNPEHRALPELLEGRGALFLSDENILGTPNRLFQDGLMYPSAAHRLRGALAILEGGDVELMLAIRDPATFVVSSYGEAMRAYGYMDFRSYFDETPLTALRWPRLVRRLLRAAPTCRMTVWTYERYLETVPQLMKQLLNVPQDAAPLPILPLEAVVRPGLSQRAIEAIRDFCEGHAEAPEQASIEDFINAYPKSTENPAPDPWTGPEKEALAQQYQRDLKVLASLERVRFLG
ncbi:MAG: hypothetical protein ACI9IV_000027 [Paracoccaceae bacterium]|jgi:hypothetical protein